MKKPKEHKISLALFCACLVLLAVSFIAGLMPSSESNIDKICMLAGFACFGLGLVYFNKAKSKDNQDK